MSTTDQMTELPALEGEQRLTLELSLEEAEALRAWLLKATAEGTSSLEVPLVEGSLTKLGRALDAIRATAKVRRELEQAGLDIGHLSDDQVRDLGRRVSEAALPGMRA